MFFLSLTQVSTENKHEVIDSNENPTLENNDDNSVSEKFNEIIDEDIVQNNSFVSNIPRDPSMDSLNEAAMQYNMISIAQINSEDCGVPMSIFDNVCINNVCIKYFFYKYMIYFNVGQFVSAIFLPVLYGHFN